jgi:hypothetical protein
MMLRKKWLLCLLILLLPSCAFAELNLYLSGNLKGQIRYTPEQKWQALKLLNSSVRLEGDSNAVKLMTKFEDIGNPNLWEPIQGAFPSINFRLTRVTLSTEAPLYNGGLPAIMAIGDLPIGYSPYIARMDDTVIVDGITYNPMAKGISIGKLQLPMKSATGKAVVDGFAIWQRNNEAQRMDEAIGLGSRLSFNLAGNNLALTYVNRTDQEQAGKSIKKADSAFLLEAARESLARSLTLTYGRNTKTEEVVSAAPKKNSATLGVFAFKQQIADGLKASFAYTDIYPGFDPAYRDRNPRFNQEGKYIGWNPIDEMRFVEGLPNWEKYHHRNYQGQLDYRAGGTAVALNVENRLLDGLEGRPDGKVNAVGIRFTAPYNKFQVSSKLKLQELKLYGANNISRDLGRQFAVEVKRDLSVRPESKLAASYLWAYQGMYEDLLGTMQQVKLEKEYTDGAIKGLGLWGGIKLDRRLADTPIFLAGLDYATGGIDVEARWASKNQIEDSRHLYDIEGKEFIGYDNIFKVGLSMAF